jgi:hypothetical protein
LDQKREETYSDWLEWILNLKQIKKPSRIIHLFGINLAEIPENCEPVTVKREHCIPHGHIDKEGRLDLCIRFGKQVILVIEIKISDADSADTEKHTGYIKWLADQPCASGQLHS